MNFPSSGARKGHSACITAQGALLLWGAWPFGSQEARPAIPFAPHSLPTRSPTATTHTRTHAHQLAAHNASVQHTRYQLGLATAHSQRLFPLAAFPKELAGHRGEAKPSMLRYHSTLGRFRHLWRTGSSDGLDLLLRLLVISKK